jgi:tRNA pseudouridine38-40 synthase
MQAAAALLVGEHDFAAFAAAGHGRLSTVRTVFECQVAQARDHGIDRPWDPGDVPERLIVISVSGSGFLWHMVRIIAGTLYEVGRGKMSVDDVAAALASGDRNLAGPTMPPGGLCLEWVSYDNSKTAEQQCGK